MIKNYSQLLIGIIAGIIVGLIAGLLIAKVVFVGNSQSAIEDQSRQNESPRRQNPRENERNPAESGNATVPAKAISVLKYIKANNAAMDGYVGGRTFANREKSLPQRDESGRQIEYQEWDVNAKVNGQNRGTERICTGSDGRSWYTNDHYRTFTEMKLP
jgi:ribonuclease T1